MPDFSVNLGRCEPKIQKKKNQKKKPLNDLKLIFLELVQLDLYSGKVWENRDFFLYCMTVVDPYSKPLLSVSVNFYKEQQRAIPHKRNVHVIWSLVVKAKWKPRWVAVIPTCYEADEGTFWGFGVLVTLLPKGKCNTSGGRYDQQDLGEEWHKRNVMCS